MKQLLLLCGLVSITTFSAAQDVLQYRLDRSERGRPLVDVLQSIEDTSSARFFYVEEWLAGLHLDSTFSDQSVDEAITTSIRGTGLSYFQIYPHTVVFVKDPKYDVLRPEIIRNAGIKEEYVEKITIGQQQNAGKLPLTISGSIVDSTSKEALDNVRIRLSENMSEAFSNTRGDFKVSVIPGRNILIFSALNFKIKVIDLVAYESGELFVQLSRMPRMLDEVVVEEDAFQSFVQGTIGKTELNTENLKYAPALLGEADVVKQLLLVPGVTTVGEATGGYNVRGGSVDQNLILFDGMPVFNPAHMFGFFSALNSELVKEGTFYKGGIPAQFGGRASSVLDLKTKDGNYQEWKIKGGLGMMTSDVVAEGPLSKNKTSLVGSLRSTYSNWLVRSIRTNYADLSSSSAFFYDAMLKVTHKLNEDTKIALTTYSSRDAFKLVRDSLYSWNNLQVSLNVFHQFSPGLTSDFVIGKSIYYYDVVDQHPLRASTLGFRIASDVLNAGFNYQMGNHTIHFGCNLNYYKTDPGTFSSKSDVSNAGDYSLQKHHSLEITPYVSDQWRPLLHVVVEAGLRLPVFLAFGPHTVSLYPNGNPHSGAPPTGTQHFHAGQTVKSYTGVEPRFSAQWIINPRTSLKAGVSRMNQYLHLMTNSASLTPLDIWLPSGTYIKPQYANQVSFGYYRELKEGLNFSAETFYKRLENVIDFKDNAKLILNENIETDLLQGKGEAYGVESAIYKNYGRLTGSVNYTYSRAFRRIAGSTSDESINDGKIYPSNADQPHIANLNWRYKISKRHFFTGSFTYRSGRPITIPISVFQFEQAPITYFSNRNQYRVKDYHRLDISFVIEGNFKKKKIANGTWVFSIYNVYARKNPYSVFFRIDKNGVPIPYQLSIVGTVLPSISYNISF